VDVLVLGCTHYPLLKPLLARVMGAGGPGGPGGPGVTLVDSAEETAQAVAAELERRAMLADGDSPATHRFVVSDDEPHFRKIGARFLGETLRDVAVVPLG
jgi:glutamate racemase